MSYDLINPNLPEFIYHVSTNRHIRDLSSWWDLPVKERADFDYITGEDRHSHRLFKYRGGWYDYYEFERTSEFFEAEGWNGLQTQSAFDAVLVSYYDHDGSIMDDGVIVGHIHW